MDKICKYNTRNLFQKTKYVENKKFKSKNHCYVVKNKNIIHFYPDKNFIAAEQKYLLKFVKNYFENYTHNTSPQVLPVSIQHQGDNRPYITVKIYDYEVTTSLDSGANKSIIGKHVIYLLDKFNLKLQKSVSNYVSTADDNKQKMEGVVNILIRIENNCRLLSTLVVPSLSQSFILGSDFYHLFSVIINFYDDTWQVHSELSNTKSGTHTYKSFSEYQQKQMDMVVQYFNKLSTANNKLGRTSVEHHIDTGDAQPIK